MMRLIWPRRRAVQVLVLASIILFPFIARYSHYLWARQETKLLERWGNSPAGLLLRGTDALMRVGLPMEESGVVGRRPRKALLVRADHFVGSLPWSARLFGLSLTDLLASAESAFATRSLVSVLAAGAIIPLLATLLLGRVYCGWICPIGLLMPLIRRLRSALAFLELPVHDVRFWKGNKYALLGAAALIGLIGGLPILHYIYPPAILSREAHSFATILFDRAESGLFGFPWGFFSGGMIFLAVVALVEVAVAPGFWCATLCPGGALYSALSRWRLLRVKRTKSACIDCVLCDKACPMQLQPMTDKTGGECDSCGVCVDVCPTKALAFKFSRTDAALMALLCLGLAAPARAHHIIGLPHYAYDESFPQAPVLRLREKLGPYEVILTGYPGNPKPGEKSELHVYVNDPATNTPYEQQVLLEAYRMKPFGFQEKIADAREGLVEMGLHKFHVVYPTVANYEVVLVLPELDGSSTLRFPLVVGEPGSPWRDVALFGGGFLALLVVVRAVKIKRARAALKEKAA
ncbi:MAG: 4Fe-4S binding protein [Elusimicrobiota bacterium]|nr:4Fe-4S binding protein [Elusimicrobiota bacterium]